MSDQKLIVSIRRQYDKGWQLPRFRLAMYRPTEGILIIKDELVTEWNRNSRVARIQDHQSGAELEFLPLFDVQVVRATPFEWALAGIERINDADRILEFAQTWAVEPVMVQR